MTDSRRERNKADKRERIVTAARELFAEFGVSAVTTNQVSDRADVAVGTLFRYAATKGELVLMAENEAVAEALETGRTAAAAETETVRAMLALVEPILNLGLEQPENTAAYQREIMFGSIGAPHHTEALDIIATLIKEIEAVLLRHVAAPTDDQRDNAVAGAQSIFAVVHLALVSAGLTGPTRLRLIPAQLEQIVRAATPTDAAAK